MSRIQWRCVTVLPEGKGPTRIFETSYKSIAYPVMADVHVTKILIRKEFR